MSAGAAGKVTAGYLARSAYLYVRQSTLREVLTSTESAARQYALRQCAVALGWPTEQVITMSWGICPCPGESVPRASAPR